VRVNCEIRLLIKGLKIMNEIIPANALQPGSTVYVDGAPATIINGSITLEQHFDEYRDKNYMLVREPNRLFTLTGSLEVGISIENLKGFSMSVGWVSVRLGKSEAKFWNNSWELSENGLILSLEASQTKFVPIACPEEVPEKLAPALAALPLGKN
jgi:hypothetical protein